MISPIVIIVIGLVVAMTWIFTPAETLLEAEKALPPPSLNDKRTQFIFTGFLYTIPGFLMLYSRRRRYPKSLHIDGLPKRNRN